MSPDSHPLLDGASSPLQKNPCLFGESFQLLIINVDERKGIMKVSQWYIPTCLLCAVPFPNPALYFPFLTHIHGPYGCSAPNNDSWSSVEILSSVMKKRVYPKLQKTQDTVNSFSETGKCQSLSRGRLFVTSWTVAHQAPLSMGFFRQEYWGR